MSKQIIGNKRGEVIDNVDPFKAGRVKVNVFGIHDDVPENAIPWAIYSDPLMGGDVDMGGMIVPEIGSHVWVFFEEGDVDQPVYFAGAPARPHGPVEARYVGTYPNNKVYKTKSGHTIEIDDSEGASRIRIAHNSGSQRVWGDEGDVEDIIVGKLLVIVDGDASIHVKGNAVQKIDGNCTKMVDGNVTENIKGDYTTNVSGRRVEKSGSGSEYLSATQVDVSGAKVALNRKKGAAVEMVDGEFVFASQYAYTYMAARDLVEEAGVNAPFDEPADADLKAESIASGEWPEEKEDTEEGEKLEVEDKTPAPVVAGCPALSKNVYATKIGAKNLTVKSGTLSPFYPHQIVAQRGLSVAQIVCNMHHLALNCIDPILANFPKLRVNSWFRPGSGSSQHEIGQGCDLQFHSGGNTAAYRAVLDFIAKSVPYDQCIIEYGNSYWIHISYNHNRATQRKQRLTYRNKKYSSDWKI